MTAFLVRRYRLIRVNVRDDYTEQDREYSPPSNEWHEQEAGSDDGPDDNNLIVLSEDGTMEG